MVVCHTLGSSSERPDHVPQGDRRGCGQTAGTREETLRDDPADALPIDPAPSTRPQTPTNPYDRVTMDQSNPMPDSHTPEPEQIPEDLAIEIRKLAHDLSNALEIIVQTSFLLSTTEMKEPGSDWLRMLDGGVQKALDINVALRAYIKEHTPK